MKYALYEPQRNVYESLIKPSIIQPNDWQVWLEFNRGMKVHEIARINKFTMHELQKVLSKVVAQLRIEPAKPERVEDVFSWEEALARRIRIQQKYKSAPIVDGYKRIRSDV